MLMPIPPILMDVIQFVPGGCVLNDDATPEQQEAFKKFEEAMKKELKDMVSSQ